ncbi:MAG: phytoene desaturase family protein, partial [Planctomycetota bacterium]
MKELIEPSTLVRVPEPPARPAEATYDTIVIGAGMSGLAAGIRLAHFDQRVCILERHSVIGGLNSYYRRHGRQYDVGLHALTNYAPKGAKRGPLPKLLRQLRISWDELRLFPQIESAVAFPGITLPFNNDFEFLLSEVRRHFPRQVDNLRRLVGMLHGYDESADVMPPRSAREVVAGVVDDPLLVEMLFCPTLFYGGSQEHDIDFLHFSILFRSIFLEGFGRPAAGVRTILKRLLEKFRDLGGELRLRTGVRQIVARGERVESVVLDDGSELRCRNVLSSAGLPETMRLCGRRMGERDTAGRMTFVEAISLLDRSAADLGHHRTIVYYNDGPKFDYRKPHDAVDLRSGTICAPDNFAYGEPSAEHMIRVSCLANYDRWAALSPHDYKHEKRRWHERIAESVVQFMPDFRPTVVEREMYTPVTIERFTGHD